MSRWIDHPSPPLVVSRAAPLLVETRLPELRKWFKRAHQVDVDVSGVIDTAGVIDGLKAVLPFPDWCGSSWDSIDDAFQELHDAWSFPLLLVVRDFDRLLREHQHVALNATIGLDDLGCELLRGGRPTDRRLLRCVLVVKAAHRPRRRM